MGVAGLIFEPHPPNFENDAKMIFWILYWFQIFKGQCGVFHPYLSAAGRWRHCWHGSFSCPYDIHFLVSKLCTGLYFFEPECSTTTMCTCRRHWRRRWYRHCRHGSFSRPFDIHFLGLLWQLAWHEINFFCQAVFKSPPFFAHQCTLGLVHHTRTQYADLMFRWQSSVEAHTRIYMWSFE